MRRGASYYGNPWIGMFVRANDSFTFVPRDSMDKFAEHFREHLCNEVLRVNVGESSLIGLYTVMNSNGMILPNVATSEEIGIFKKLGLNVHVSGEKQNAHGNNIAVNDKGGIINPHIHANERKRIGDALGVELVPMKIAQYVTVGAACLAGNKGFLAHFSATEPEMREIESALKVPGERGTVNMGTGFVSYGLVINKSGYVAGEATSAHEMGRAESALGYIK
jgi:translation initiation factor 6